MQFSTQTSTTSWIFASNSREKPFSCHLVRERGVSKLFTVRGSFLSQNACSFSMNNVRRRHILQRHGCTTRFPVSPHRCTRDVRHVLDAPRVGMTRICEIAARYLLGGSARTIFRAVTVGATQFFHSSSSAWSLDLFPKRKKVKIIFSAFFKSNFQKNGRDPHMKPNFVPKHGFFGQIEPGFPRPRKKNYEKRFGFIGFSILVKSVRIFMRGRSRNK